MFAGYTAALQANSQPVAVERIQAAADSDTATRQTVAVMCRNIAESTKDPLVQDAAQYVRRNFAQGDQPALLSWGVFWFAKHNCKFVVDEAPLMRFERIAPGSGLGQQDLLISPAVLLRLAPWERKGDCDDFTMLVCALLKCLGVPFVIITICADPSDPSRWSHVFPMALTPAAIALDASHGCGPGWIVPASHTFKWQAWDENGDPVDVPRPQSRLHGWEPSGLGQDTTDLSSLPLESTGGGGLDTIGQDLSSFFQGGATSSITNAMPTSSDTGFNWTSFFNNLTTQAAGVAKVAEVNNMLPYASQATTNIFSSLLPIVALVLIGGLAISMLKK